MPGQPRDTRDFGEAVAQATAAGSALEIVGGGTKRGIGFPDRNTIHLSTANLSRVVDYDPAELILTVEPGARLADIEALLDAQNQMLAFEPWDFAETAGGQTGRSTIGGVVASGLSGSRRLSAGGVRDHVLGFSAVNGLGEAFKAGGKVVKNVTGYDLSKLVTGSWGQVCVLTEITLKVLPKPSVVKTLAIRALAAGAAVEAMGRAMRSPANVAAASWRTIAGDAPGVTALRIEGFGPSVEARLQMLSGLLEDFGPSAELDPAEADAHWRLVCSGKATTAPNSIIWRMSVPPARGADMVAGIRQLGGNAMLDLAGGLAWAHMPTGTSTSAVRELAERAGGHAMLILAPDDVRANTPALHPEPHAVAALSRRVREAFDPARVFDPLRFEAAP